MARLFRDDGTVTTLPARCLIGRSAACGVVVRDPRVSAEHAVVAWDGARWGLRDLGSRNGTWVGGRPVAPGELVALSAGDLIEVGGPDLALRIADVDPPKPTAWTAGGRRAPPADVLLLPDADRARLAVFADERGTWWAEHEDGARAAVHDGGALLVDGETWTLSLPAVLAPTLDARAAPQVSARFRVSRNEEHCELDLLVGEMVFAIPHHAWVYALLTLARHRVADAHLPEAEQGWVHQDALSDGLRLSTSSLGVYVHRARQQAAIAGAGVASAIVERRRGSRELRFGLPVREIVQA